jgi:putative salt-induced outer membrane protein YdiY
MREMKTVCTTIFVLALFLMVALPNAFASQVTLKNGDRISGSVTASSAESLTIHSQVLGDIQIPWNAVERANIQEAVFVPAAFKKGASPPRQSSQPDPAKKEAVRSVQGSSPATDFLRHWSGSIDPGFTWTNGNVNSRTFNVAVNAARTMGGQKVSFSMNWLHTNNFAGGRSFTTAKAVRSGTRVDHNLNEGFFVFGSGNWEYDRFQQLDLRNVLGSGVGWHAIKRKTFRMDFLSGGNFNRESFNTGLRRNYLEAIGDQEVNYHPNDHVALRGHVMLVPNLTQPGHYRGLIEATAVTSLTKSLGWQITLTDRYTSLHLPGVKPNDAVVTTGLRFAFSR